MTVNILGYWGIGIIVIMVALVFVIAYKIKPSKNNYVITPEESQRFLNDSIAIQPNNSTVFKERDLDDVIEDGFSIMQKENYRMLKGVNVDGI